MNKLLEHFIDITGIPVSSLHPNGDGKLTYREGYPKTVPHLKELASLFPYEKLERGKSPAVLPAGQFALYGYLSTGKDERLIVGPVFEFPLDNQSARYFLESMNASKNDLKNVIEYQ